MLRTFADHGLGSSFIVVAEGNSGNELTAAVLLELAAPHTVVDPEQLSRYATVVGQIECICLPENREEIVLKHSEPLEKMFAEIQPAQPVDPRITQVRVPAPVEEKRWGLDDLLRQAESNGGGDLGLELRIARPSAVVRPICIYK